MSDREQLVERSFRSVMPSFWGVGVLSIFINLLMLTGPIYMLQIYDRVLSSSSVPTLFVISTLAVALYLFYGLLEAMRARVILRIGQRIDAQISPESYDISTKLPLILGAKASSLRPVNDIDTLRQFMSGPGPAAIFDVPWLPIYLVMIFLFHPVLGLTALGGAVVISVLIGLREMITHKPVKEFTDEISRRGRLVENTRRNSEVVQAMGMMHSLKDRWQHGNNEYLDKQRRMADATGAFGTIVKTLRLLLQSMILGVGAWLVIGQEISAGVMIAASIMTSRALSPVEQAVAHWSGFVSARQARKRLKEVFEKRFDQTGKMELPIPTDKIVLEQVCCGPIGVQQIIVQGVSLELNAGDGMGIIGHSGSGKSTLARAIVGITPVLRGSIRFDGSELEQWPPESIGKIIGYLPQDVQLFDGTISENISRFTANADPNMVIEAAQNANVHDMITALPEGYNTIIGTGGYLLSAGQQQRVALARAIFGKPFVVLLDEPNSNLDAEGENALAHAIINLRKAGSIVIVIAHRPNAIGAVNKVLCMNEGKPVALGPRDEVLKKVLAQPNKSAD